MFWTKHNWESGAIIALSPSAQKLEISVSVGTVDNIIDGFYDYQILKGDGNLTYNCLITEPQQKYLWIILT